MATVANISSQQSLATRPYPPGWFDHFKAWVERLPIPTWLFYLLLAALFVIIELGVQWQSGNLSANALPLYHIWFVLQSVFLLAVLHYLDRTAGEAFDSFRQALDINEQDAARLRRQLTTLPARPAFWISFIVMLLSPLWLLITPATYAPLGMERSMLNLVVNLIFYLMSWWLGGFTVYHAIHQLKMVSRTYEALTKINLFKLHPLYALSGVTARTTIGFIVYMTAWSIALPQTFTQTPTVAMALPLILFALITFVVPLWGIHQRLMREKERAQGEAGTRITHALAAFHQAVDQGAAEQAIQNKELVAAIEFEYALVGKVPTWPWQPETFRILITALLFPIVLFVLQYVIQRAFTP